MSKKDKLDNGYRLDDFGLLFSDEKSKTREKSILLRKKNAESSADSANSQNLDKNQSREAQPEKASLRQVLNSGKGVVAEGEGSDFAIRKNLRIQASAPSLKENSRSEKWDSNADLSARERGEIDSANSQNLQAELPLRFAEYARNDDFLDATKSAESNIPPQKSQSKKLKEQDFIYAPQFQGFDEILDESKDFSAQDSNTQDSNAQKQGAESSPKSQINPQSEKDLLLRHPHTQNDTNALFIAYSILFLMLLAFMPQIYLANNIYTSSKNINLLKAQKDALRDENSDLQKQLESVKFNFLTLEIEEIK